MVTTPARGMPETLGYRWQGMCGVGAGSRSCTMGAGEPGQGAARLQDPSFFTQMIAEIKCVEDQEVVALKEHTAVHLLALNYSFF